MGGGAVSAAGGRCVHRGGGGGGGGGGGDFVEGSERGWRWLVGSVGSAVGTVGLRAQGRRTEESRIM